jgi:hypothetical protein
MSIEILEKLFGSSARVKVMKLFLFNPEELLEKSEIIKKTKSSSTSIKKELKDLCDMGLLKKRIFIKSTQTKSGKTNKKKVQGFVLNTSFKYINNLKNLLLNNEPFNHSEIIKKLNKVGKIKLIVVSGLFIQDEDSRLDIFMVGDDLKERAVKTVISKMEAEIGKELRYSFFTTNDFKYRYSVCDRLVRDVFDYPHQVVVDRIGL